MKKLTHNQNLIILVSLENFLIDEKKRNKKLYWKLNQIEELIKIYNKICFNIK